MSFTDQINSLSKSCHFHIRDLRRIRHLLLLSEATALANLLVSSKLDYSNSLYNDISQANLNKIQRIQNTLARVVTNTSKSEHITPILKKLHWLPIKQCIDYELCLFTYFIIIICHSALTNKNVFNCFSKETNIEFEFREYEGRMFQSLEAADLKPLGPLQCSTVISGTRVPQQIFVFWEPEHQVV